MTDWELQDYGRTVERLNREIARLSAELSRVSVAARRAWYALQEVPLMDRPAKAREAEDVLRDVLEEVQP